MYRSFPELGKATVPDADVSVARRELDLNLAVVREDPVLELNQAFNFQVDNPAKTRSHIDAWTLKIDILRQEGGKLKYNDSSLPSRLARTTFRSLRSPWTRLQRPSEKITNCSGTFAMIST